MGPHYNIICLILPLLCLTELLPPLFIKVHSLHVFLVTQGLKMTARTVETCSQLPTTCSNIYIYI